MIYSEPTREFNVVDMPRLPPELSRYQLREILGTGGSGRVFRARDSILLRDVAIKIISRRHNSPSLDEARALAKIDHKNVVKIYDVICDEHHIAIVMELVEVAQVSSATSIANMKPVEFYRYFNQVLFAVRAIHCQGLLHLDLKPENILLNMQGQVKVTDFGISLDIYSGAGGEAHAIRGSWFGISPERVSGVEASAASDLFSLGVIWYTYIYGEHPFLVEGDASASRRNLVRAKQKFRVSAEPIDEHCESLLRRLLEREPARRPSLETIIQYTREQNASEGYEDLPTGTLAISKKKTPRWRQLFFHIIFGVLVSAAVLVLFSLGVQPKYSLVVPTLIVSKNKTILRDSYQNTNFLVANIIQDELEAATISDPNRVLVSNKEWGGSRDWKMEAKQMDIDEIIISEVICKKIDCKVSLSLFDRKLARTTRVASKYIPHDDLMILSQVVATLIGTDLEFTGKHQHSVHDISEEDLQSYYDYRHKLESLDNRESDIAVLERFSKNKPNFLGAKLLLGSSYLALYDKTDNEKWLKKSTDLINTMKHRFANHPATLKLEFEHHIESNNLEYAKSTLLKMKGRSGVDVNRLLLSESYIEFKNNQPAGYQSLLSIENPRLTHSYYHFRAYMEQHLNLHENLEVTSRDWIKRFPESDRPNFFLAESFLSQGRLEEAKDLHEEFFNRQQDYHSLLNMGICEFFLGAYEKSILHYQRAVEMSSSADAFLNLAEAIKAAKKSGSEEYFRMALRKYRKTDNPSSLNLAYQALALAHLGHEDEALTAMQNSAFSQESDDSFFLIAAYTYSLLDKPETALHNAREAQKRGFRRHFFRTPWTMDLYNILGEIS